MKTVPLAFCEEKDNTYSYSTAMATFSVIDYVFKKINHENFEHYFDMYFKNIDTKYLQTNIRINKPSHYESFCKTIETYNSKLWLWEDSINYSKDQLDKKKAEMAIIYLYAIIMTDGEIVTNPTGKNEKNIEHCIINTGNIVNGNVNNSSMIIQNGGDLILLSGNATIDKHNHHCYINKSKDKK